VGIQREGNGPAVKENERRSGDAVGELIRNGAMFVLEAGARVGGEKTVVTKL